MKKIHTATFKGYSHYASYYINNDSSGLDTNEKEAADTVLEKMRADYGPSAYILDCGDTTFFDIPDYGSQLKGDCTEYRIVYNPMETIAEKRKYYFLHSDGEQITGAYWTAKNNMVFPTREKPLPWQARGLMYTRTGYGKKIPTSKQLFVLNRWRRIYCSIFSNSGVCFVIIDGHEVNIDDCNMQSREVDYKEGVDTK